jgi:hypothetical protein
MTQHIHIHIGGARKTRDATPPSIRAHSQFTEADYNYLKGKGWSDNEILKRWDAEAKTGTVPQKGNKNAKPGQPGYINAFRDVARTPAQIKKEYTEIQILQDKAKEKGDSLAVKKLETHLDELEKELREAKKAT